MIGHVWYSALVGWVNGWSTMARVYDELAVSVRLLLPDSSSTAGAHPPDLDVPPAEPGPGD
jgi:hypothetical protein